MSQVLLMLVLVAAPLRAGLVHHRYAPTAAPAGIQKLSNIEYGRVGHRALLLDLYQLQRSDSQALPAPRPAVIWVHGGAWRSGSKNRVPPSAFMLARRGYVVASVEYRLTQEAFFPAQINDVKCAVRYLRSHAKQYDIDPDRIGAYGASAGGQLVALLGTDADDARLEGNGGWPNTSSRVQAVIDEFGPTDFLSILQQAKNLVPEADVASRMLFGGPMDAVRQLAKLASPVDHVSADDPPFLIIHGQNDPLVPLAQSRELLDALRHAGVDARLVVAPGFGHGVWGARYDRMIVDFFEQHLGT